MQIWRRKNKKFRMLLMCPCSHYKNLLNKKSQGRFKNVLDKTGTALKLFYKLNSILICTFINEVYF